MHSKHINTYISLNTEVVVKKLNWHFLSDGAESTNQSWNNLFMPEKICPVKKTDVYSNDYKALNLSLENAKMSLKLMHAFKLDIDFTTIL
jgi:hypothetical protein